MFLKEIITYDCYIYHNLFKISRKWGKVPTLQV